MHRSLLFSITLIISILSKAQDKTLPSEARPFLPAGYEMLDYITGDINNDKKTDAILLCRRPDEDSVMEEELIRPMLILVRQADGKLKQAVRNDHAILCRHCGGVFGDPYEGIEIK